MATWCPPGAHTFQLPLLRPSLFFRPLKRASQPCPAHLSRPTRRHHVTETIRKTPLPQLSPEQVARLNPNPDEYYQTNFADQAKIQVYAGNGGHGCISFHREAYVAEGPANGGDGGSGGNIYIQATYSETSLHKLARRRIHRAAHGTTGRGSNQGGQRGEDVIINVPVGTIVKEITREDPEAQEAFLRRLRRRKQTLPSEEEERAKKEAAERRADWERQAQGHKDPPPPPDEDVDPDAHRWVLYPGMTQKESGRLALPKLPFRDRLFTQPPDQIHLDLSRPTTQPILLATGGIGGLGNPHFVSKQYPRPLFATKGEKAVSMELELELKLLADVGLVGLPNAGKSTLVRSLTNSRARVGSWEFTTLKPNIGTVVLDNNRGRPLVMSHFRPNKSSNTKPSNDGIMRVRDTEEPEEEIIQRKSFTIADIPGLIEGAHLDKGLGMEFLRHVERAGVLAFVIDLSAQAPLATDDDSTEGGGGGGGGFSTAEPFSATSNSSHASQPKGEAPAVIALKSLWNEVGLYAQMRELDEQQARKKSNTSDSQRGTPADQYPRRSWNTTSSSSSEDGTSSSSSSSSSSLYRTDYPSPPAENESGLHIAAKPWFVVATKADLPGTQENFRELRSYLAKITKGDEPHPSGIEGAWRAECAAIAVSAMKGMGVERVVHWTVGLLDK